MVICRDAGINRYGDDKLRDPVSEKDVHPHLAARLAERGITLDELNVTLANGWQAEDAKEGTFGKVYVFDYNQPWLGRVFVEKEVSIYYKVEHGRIVPLTAKARYGSNFPKKGENP